MNKASPLVGKIATLTQALAGETVSQISLDRIDLDPNQPRKTFKQQALEELAGSIKLQGVLQPVVVVRNGDRFTLVVGERRYRASQLAGKSDIPAIVRTLDVQTIKALQLIENIHREEVNAMEQAIAIKEYIDTFLGGVRHGIGKVAADAMGLSETTVSEALQLLNLSSPELRQAVDNGNITDANAAVALDRLNKENPAAAAPLIDKAKKEKVTRTEVRAAKAAAKAEKKQPPADPAPDRCPNTPDMLGGDAPAVKNSDNATNSAPDLSAIGDNPGSTDQLVNALGPLLDKVDGVGAVIQMAALVRQMRQRALALGLNWDDILAGAAYDTDNKNGGKTHGRAA